MLLPSLYLLATFAGTLGASPHPPHVTEPERDVLPPARSVLVPRAPPGWISYQATVAHETWYNHAVAFWNTAAVLPVVAAVPPLSVFYQKVALAVVRLLIARDGGSGRRFGLGALTLSVDTLDGSPIDWDMVFHFTSRMIERTNRGWTQHYTAMVRNTVTEVVTMISLEAGAEAAGAWLNGGTSREQLPHDPFGS